MRRSSRPQSQDTADVEQSEISEVENDQNEEAVQENPRKLPENEKGEGELNEEGLSEGEIFVPKKMRKKQRKGVSEKTELTDKVCDENPPAMSEVDLNEGGKIPSNEPTIEQKARIQKNRRGRFVHKGKKKAAPKDENPVQNRPKSFYAAVCLSYIEMLITSYCKVKWKGRMLYYYKHYCISESMGC